jgi:hypothetical protein
MASERTEAGDLLCGYVYGVLMAFMEPTDPRMERIRSSVMEKTRAIEAEARQQGRDEERDAIRAEWLARPDHDVQAILDTRDREAGK